MQMQYLIRSTLFALSLEISTKHDNNKNKQDTPHIRNRPVQRVEVEDSILHKWAKKRRNFAFLSSDIPVGTRHLYKVASTPMQRHDVASTLRRHCINVMCPLG